MPERIGAIGRLDRQTSGLMILTDDAWFNTLVCRGKATKRYQVVLAGTLANDDPVVEELRQPHRYECREAAQGREVWTQPAQVKVLSSWHEPVRENQPSWLGNRTKIEVSLTEGKHRQIRRLVSRSNLCLFSLHRVAVGPVELAGLAPGQVRRLAVEELAALCVACGKPAAALDAAHAARQLPPWYDSAECDE